MQTLCVLGSTGSIGVQALEVAELMGLQIVALTAHSSVRALEEQIRRFKPLYAAMADEKAAAELKTRVADTGTRVFSGNEGVCECAAAGADCVLNSIVGMAGLMPTLAAAGASGRIALANKETLVAGGSLVMGTVEAAGVELLPVDSEHSAVFQSLLGCASRKEIKRLILTASGGPFFGKTEAELQNITVEQALKHPNWSMGAKITVDSATMMNKGLELIEAKWLFDVSPQQIDIVVHRQSVVHSLVEYVDNSVIAQLGVPDMRIPIQLALTYPNRLASPVEQLSLVDFGTLTFDKPDYETFSCINVCRRAITAGGLHPAAANSANEAANELFRNGKIPFLKIAELVSLAEENTPQGDGCDLQSILETDEWARSFVLSHI